MTIAISRTLVFAAIACFSTLSFAANTKTVSVSAQFGDYYNSPIIDYVPIDTGAYIVDLHDVTGGSATVTFEATYKGYDTLSNGLISEIIEISYHSLFGVGSLFKPGYLTFDGHDANGKSVVIDKVIDYSFAWNFDDSASTDYKKSFSTGILGVSNSGTFTLNYTAPVPEPESYAMLLAGLGLMGGVARRCKKSKAAS